MCGWLSLYCGNRGYPRLKNWYQEQETGLSWAGLFVSLQLEMRELMMAEMPIIRSESKVAHHLHCYHLAYATIISHLAVFFFFFFLLFILYWDIAD